MAVMRLMFCFLIFCQISGIAIFLKGFFPLKKNTPGYSKTNINGSLVRGKFDRLIVIMIDALRADFVFGNNSFMNFTKSLITHRQTYSFQAHSNPPTVTMPRIKAITSGAIPGFIDVILNVDSKELTEDNLITQMKNSKKNIIFYGDDTWIKLFPNHFLRQDGTTSFFVTDYVEVDNNVTRHVVPELVQSDWDVMILHYLGLDHIGHLAGPFSPLVQPKLNEMDQIIEGIYKTAVRQDFERNISTLMVLCGDHGMSDGGSHGGSSSAETTTPLVFMSSLFGQHGKLYERKKVNQIDITPTLAILFGLSIPKNSIGVLISDLISLYSVEKRLEALRMNAVQIFEVYQSNADNELVVEFDLAARLHKEWLKDYHNKTRSSTDLEIRAEQISKLYYSGMEVMTKRLTKYMSSYDFYALYIGVWLLLQSLLGVVSLHIFPEDLFKSISTHFATLSISFLVVACLLGSFHIHLCSTSLGRSELLCVPSMLSLSLSSIFILSTAITVLSWIVIFINISTFGLPGFFCTSSVVNTKTVTFLVLGLLLHNISLLSTSYIEEEHQTWYFLTTSYHFILLCEIYLTNLSTIHPYFGKEEISTSDFSLGATSSRENLVTEKAKNKEESKDHIDKRTDFGKKRTTACVFVLLFCDRTLRSWNQTGIKWSDQPDVQDWLVNPENKTLLSLLTIISLLGITLSIFHRIKTTPCGLLMFTIFTTGQVGVYLYRAVTGSVKYPQVARVGSPEDGIQFAQFVHLCVLVLAIKSLFQLYYDRKSGCLTQPSGADLLVSGYVLLISLLLRAHNAPLVAIMLLQVHVHRKVIWKRCESNVEIILSAYYIGWFTYFAQGNSNSLATVDIGAGYIGLGQNYWPVFVALLTSLATFSGPLFWLMEAVIYIQSKSSSSDRSSSAFGVGDVLTILVLIKSLNLTVCTILSWLNCYHLFVWSVFSPKLLYEGVVSLVIAAFILTASTVIKI